jgi:hypothetical protein
VINSHTGPEAAWGILLQMRRWILASTCSALAACSFSPGKVSSDSVLATDDAALDDAGGSADEDAPADAAADAMPDALVPPSVTNHPVTADTFLASDVATTNFNSQISALTDGDIQRVALFRFDLTTIAATATVSAVELHIWTDDDPGRFVEFYAALESWSETTTTWNVRTTGTNWMTAGAAPPSRGTTVLGTVDPTTTFTEYVVTILPSAVAGWVANPVTNFGFVLVTTNADGTRFATLQHPTAGVHAYLRVTHTP